jgi:hypothetical protein
MKNLRQWAVQIGGLTNLLPLPADTLGILASPRGGADAGLAASQRRSLPLPAEGKFISRSQHLLAIGRPAAQIALLHPTDSMWLNDKEADTVTLRLVTQLLEHQIDFDHIPRK